MKHNVQDFFKRVCYRAWITNKQQTKIKKQTEQQFFNWLLQCQQKFNACTSKEIILDQKDITHHYKLSLSQW